LSSLYESRCKVCNSPNRKVYEDFYLKSVNKTCWTELEEKAKVLAEDISCKSFERHFRRHFQEGIVELQKKEELVSGAVEGVKQEVIDTVQEIKNNLNGLKTLLTKALEAYEDKSMSPAMLKGLTELYREHRQSIESCEHLTSKLTAGTNLSEAEMLKILYIFAKDFCPICTEKFKKNLDEYLKRKQNA